MNLPKPHELSRYDLPSLERAILTLHNAAYRVPRVQHPYIKTIHARIQSAIDRLTRLKSTAEAMPIPATWTREEKF